MSQYTKEEQLQIADELIRIMKSWNDSVETHVIMSEQESNDKVYDNG